MKETERTLCLPSTGSLFKGLRELGLGWAEVRSRKLHFGANDGAGSVAEQLWVLTRSLIWLVISLCGGLIFYVLECQPLLIYIF